MTEYLDVLLKKVIKKHDKAIVDHNIGFTMNAIKTDEVNKKEILKNLKYYDDNIHEYKHELFVLSGGSISDGDATLLNITLSMDENIKKRKEEINDKIDECKKNEERIRMQAAIICGELQIKDAIDPLIDSLNDKYNYKKVRLHSLSSLGQIGDPSAVKPIKKLLKEEKDKGIIKAAKKTLNILMKDSTK